MTTDQRGHRHRRGKPSRPRDLRGLWRTLLALIAPLPGLLMAAKIMVSPFGIRADFAAVLSGVDSDPAREQLALWLGLAFSLTVLPAVLAVAWASRRRSPWFALAGGVLSVIGFSVGFAVPDSSAAALVAVQQGLDATKVAVINEVVSATTVVAVTSVIFLVASSTGLILLGVAQWRARTGPRWLAVLLGLSGAAHLLPAGTAWRPQHGLPLGSAASARRSASFSRRTMTSTWHPTDSNLQSGIRRLALDLTLVRSGAPCWLLPARRSRSTSRSPASCCRTTCRIHPR